MDVPTNTARLYSPNSKKAAQLLISGLVACAVMVICSFILRALGIPAPDFGAIYGAVPNDQTFPEAFSLYWCLGLTWHFLTGIIVFPFVGDFLADRGILPTRTGIRGVCFAVGLWIVFSLVIAPASGLGPFFTNTEFPISIALCNLLVWIIYGLVLDATLRTPIVHEIRISHRRAA